MRFRHPVGFRPERLATCLHWRKADDPGVVYNGSNLVSLWPDIGPNAGTADALDCTQSSGAAKPTFITSVSTMNNMPALAFHGANASGNYLVSPVLGAARAQPVMRFAVFMVLDPAGGFGGSGFGGGGAGFVASFVFDRAPAGSARQALLFENDDLVVGQSRLYGHAGSSLGTVAQTLRYDTTYVVCMVFNGGSSYLYINDASTPAASGGAGSNGYDSVIIGASNGLVQGMPGVICEEGAVTATDITTDYAVRSQIMRYLGAKYGATVTP